MSAIAFIREKLKADPFKPFPISSVDPRCQFWIEHRECVKVWENDQGITVVDEHNVEREIRWANLPTEFRLDFPLPPRINCKRFPGTGPDAPRE
jgi:hypothetical protein